MAGAEEKRQTRYVCTRACATRPDSRRVWRGKTFCLGLLSTCTHRLLLAPAPTLNLRVSSQWPQNLPLRAARPSASISHPPVRLRRYLRARPRASCIRRQENERQSYQEPCRISIGPVAPGASQGRDGEVMEGHILLCVIKTSPLPLLFDDVPPSGFWMSDKPLVQQALATEIADILLAITNLSTSLAFLRGFWESTVREWNTIDRLRYVGPAANCLLRALILLLCQNRQILHAHSSFRKRFLPTAHAGRMGRSSMQRI